VSAAEYCVAYMGAAIIQINTVGMGYPEPMMKTRKYDYNSYQGYTIGFYNIAADYGYLIVAFRHSLQGCLAYKTTLTHSS